MGFYNLIETENIFSGKPLAQPAVYYQSHFSTEIIDGSYSEPSFPIKGIQGPGVS
jgi:hypothetical protein